MPPQITIKGSFEVGSSATSVTKGAANAKIAMRPQMAVVLNANIHHSNGFFKVLSSFQPALVDGAGKTGIKSCNKMMMSKSISATTRKMARQSWISPKYVVKGTISNKATPMPAINTPMALPKWCDGSICAKITPETPKNTPCGTPEKKRTHCNWL